MKSTIEPYHILLVDDHPLILSGMTQLIEQEEDMKVCFLADGFKSALKAARELKPDAAVVDLMLGDGDGVNLIPKIREYSPKTRIVVLSMLDETMHAERCIRAGAHAYVMKSEAPTRTTEAIRSVLRNEIFVSDAMRTKGFGSKWMPAIVCALSLACASALAADTGFRSPTACGTNDFTNPANAFSSNGVYAVGSPNSGGSNAYYRFGFSIPIGSSIDGIEVKVLWARASTPPNSCDLGCRLAVGSVEWTTNSMLCTNTTTFSDSTWGGPTYKWGRTWTAAELSDGSFRVDLYGSDWHPDAYVDWLRVKVYYSPAPTLTASKVGNGTISPSGAVTVDYNGTTNFLIAADANYHIASIKTGGVDIAGSPFAGNGLTATNYTWANVLADSTIEATFAVNTYTITASAGANGTINPSGAVTVDYNGTTNFQIAADANYHIASIKTGGVDIAGSPFPGNGLTATNYIWANIVADSTIEATFAVNTYTITASAGANGTISPLGGVQVDSIGSTSFVVAASLHYHIETIETNGVILDCAYGNGFTNTSVVWSNPTADGTIVAGFAENMWANNTPETWLAAFYPGTNDFDSAAASDTDRDGLAAWQEYVAGTDPTDAASCLVFVGVGTANGSNYVSWLSFTNWRSDPYILQMSTNLLSGAWTTVDGAVSRTPPTNTYWLAGSDTRAFYRVVCTNSP